MLATDYRYVRDASLPRVSLDCKSALRGNGMCSGAFGKQEQNFLVLVEHHVNVIQCPNEVWCERSPAEAHQGAEHRQLLAFLLISFLNANLCQHCRESAKAR